ncbi:hypothetical protein JAAARDRAFT_132917, partial [Jaapia argillacea MUCL 33604]
PDLYLSELRDALWEAHHIDVDKTTISHTLKRHGFSRKHVSCLLPLHIHLNTQCSSYFDS